VESVSLGDRPLHLYVPSTYQPGTAAPLVIALHGYTGSGSKQENYLTITPEA
jgi:polyhydroxybutyrate depolymerase